MTGSDHRSSAIALARALARFSAGAGVATLLILLGRLVLVGMLGDAVLGPPELQMERMAEALRDSGVLRRNTLVLGDSTAVFSVAAKELPDAVSLATLNATPMEFYFTLRRVLEGGGKPSCVLLSGSWAWRENHGYFWPMFVAGRFYGSTDLEEIYLVTNRNGDPPGRIGRIAFDGLNFLYGHGILNGISLSRIQDGIFQYGDRSEKVQRIRHGLRAQLGNVSLRDHASFEGRREPRFGDVPEVNASEMEFVGKLFDLLERNGIRLFLLELPFPRDPGQQDGKRYWSLVEDLIKRAAGKNPMAYSRIAPTSVPDEHYLSAGHLDAEGVKKIMPEVRAALDACHGKVVHD